MIEYVYHKRCESIKELQMKKIVREYKQGRQKNFFVREDNGICYLEKITKSCGFTIMCGAEEEVYNYIDNNGYTFVGLVVVA